MGDNKRTSICSVHISCSVVAVFKSEDAEIDVGSASSRTSAVRIIIRVYLFRNVSLLAEMKGMDEISVVLEGEKREMNLESKEIPSERRCLRLEVTRPKNDSGS